MAIVALRIRAPAVKRKIERLDIEGFEIGRLHVRRLIVEQERKPVVEQEQTDGQGSKPNSSEPLFSGVVSRNGKGVRPCPKPKGVMQLKLLAHKPVL